MQKKKPQQDQEQETEHGAEAGDGAGILTGA
jgi:hypothetical protein